VNLPEHLAKHSGIANMRIPMFAAQERNEFDLSRAQGAGRSFQQGFRRNIEQLQIAGLPLGMPGRNEETGILIPDLPARIEARHILEEEVRPVVGDLHRSGGKRGRTDGLGHRAVDGAPCWFLGPHIGAGADRGCTVEKILA